MAGGTPSTRKNSADTRCCVTYSACVPTTMFTPIDPNPPAVVASSTDVTPRCSASQVPPVWPYPMSPREKRVITMAIRSGCGYGSGRSSTRSTTVYIAVLAPMHSASVRTAVTVKTGDFSRTRTAYRKSRIPALDERGFRDVGELAKLEPLNLARRSFGQLLDELHPLR